jgi:hypothetical protein
MVCGPIDEIFKMFSHHLQPKFVVTAVRFIRRELLPFAFVDVLARTLWKAGNRG